MLFRSSQSTPLTSSSLPVVGAKPSPIWSRCLRSSAGRRQCPAANASDVSVRASGAKYSVESRPARRKPRAANVSAGTAANGSAETVSPVHDCPATTDPSASRRRSKCTTRNPVCEASEDTSVALSALCTSFQILIAASPASRVVAQRSVVETRIALSARVNLRISSSTVVVPRVSESGRVESGENPIRRARTR